MINTIRMKNERESDHMFKKIKSIHDYFKKKKLKKLLKERIIKMGNTLDIDEGQFIIDGKVYNDKEIIDRMMEWASKNFVFRVNDVFLPEVPEPLISYKVKEKHKELDIPTFIDKYGNFALKYLMYNAFILGYESGLNKGNNDHNEEVNHIVDDMINKSEIKEKEETVDKIINEEEIITTINEAIKPAKDDFMNPPVEDDEKEETVVPEPVPLEPHKEEKTTLDLNSSSYPDRTYEKFITSVIEQKLHSYGMSPNDITIKGFPTFILGELLIEIEKADAINDDQKAIKDKFYNYIKDIHTEVTKVNTTT